MDFGDAASSLIVRITQQKFIRPRAELEATKYTVLKGGYADNYSYTISTLEEFRGVSADMEKIHNYIGLPLKATYADIGTDAEILKKLGKEMKSAQPMHSSASPGTSSLMR